MNINGKYGTLSRLAPLLLCALVLLAACGSDDAAEKDAKNALDEGQTTGHRARYGNLSRDGYDVQGYDLNQDGKEDQWVVKSSSKTERIERDMNFDGQVDLWQYPGDDGKIAEEEMDLDLDGKIDVVVFYKNGVVSRKEMSVDFDGGFSIVKFYDKDGKLLRVERDEDGDGEPDRWEYYEKGQRVRVGWDEDGDGTPDNFDKLD